MSDAVLLLKDALRATALIALYAASITLIGSLSCRVF